jgi:hypothetical protein
MKGFGYYYQKAQLPEWELHYVDYPVLKERLRSYRKRRRQQQRDWEDNVDNVVADDDYVPLEEHASISASTGASVPTWRFEREDFCTLIENEWNKAISFYHKSPLLNDDWKQRMSSTQKDVSAQAVSELLSIWSFLVANIISLRQLLLRYNAFAQTYHDACPIQEWDLHLPEESSLKRILNQLYATKELGLRSCSTSQHIHRLQQKWEALEELLERTRFSSEKAASGRVGMRDQLRQYFLIGSQRFGFSLEPKFMRLKGRHLKREILALRKWQSSAEPSHVNKLDPANVWPLALNMLSCFLFMMNNYIIEPSSAYYANALGSSDALSGLMIGAAPWFALVSAVGYSVWTNRNYKTPILFAAALMVFGNTLYASAYSFTSMELCLVGRAITGTYVCIEGFYVSFFKNLSQLTCVHTLVLLSLGLGAPRIINRRYVADATPFALRTMASAAFALVTALGAALGPGMAIVLDALPEFEFSLPVLGIQYFNGMTGPGYFMALCWMIYFIAVLLTFDEPKRVGLVELQQREALEECGVSEEGTSTTDGHGDMIDDDESDTESTVSSESVSPKKIGPFSCFQHISTATAMCMSLIFMKRIALESIVGSTSVITKNRYGWSIQNVGTLHLANGIIVIPVSILAGYMSRFHQDRQLATWFIVITICGMLFLVDLSDLVDTSSSATYNADSPWAVGPTKYIIGSFIAFSGIEACESFVASLMSKVVCSKLAVGTFNSGLLTTLVGTSGRAVGDLFITCMGLISIRSLLNLLILPGLAVMLGSLFLLRRNYQLLDV